MDAPPTREQWLVDGQMRGGHTPAETMQDLRSPRFRRHRGGLAT
jgi:hypothetical protein